VQWHLSVFPNFDLRTDSTPSDQSTSRRSSAMTSPMRMPEAASSPMAVSTVAARSGDGMVRPTWRLNAAMSSVE
jgi:hypothetical protein